MLIYIYIHERFNPLLLAEQSEEESLIKERLTKWPVEKLRDEGYCIIGLDAFWMDAHHFGKPVAIFTLGPGEHLGTHHFK